MGILSKIFGIKDEPKLKFEMRSNEKTGEQVPLKDVPENIQDLLLLAVSERYKVDETEFPDYFRSEYGVEDPNQHFKAMEEAGLIRIATAKESLSNLKVVELKDIAEKFGVNTSGKKDVLCSKIADSIPENELEKMVNVRCWKITNAGRELLNNNPYIEYFVGKHPYSLASADIDINRLHQLVENNPSRKLRDLVWGEFNRKSLELFEESSKSRRFRSYGWLLADMALFLEEEGRYKDALAGYLKYIFYNVNYDAGLEALKQYSYSKDVNDSAEHLFVLAEMLPFMNTNIQRMSDECGFDEKQLHKFMLETFDKYSGGLLSSKDMSAFAIAGMKNDKETQKKLCKKAIRYAAKEMPKY